MSPTRAVPGRLVAVLLVLGAIGTLSCKKGMPLIGAKSPSATSREDALFLAEAPAIVPDELAPELDAMGIRRLFIAAGSLGAGGQVRPFPPPPTPIGLPVVLVLEAEPGAEAGLRGGSPESLGETWAAGLKRTLDDAKPWARVTGVHLHLLPSPADAPALAKALAALKARLPGLTVSISLLSGAPPGSWEALRGAADEALVFSLGRRPETGDRFAKEMSEEEAKAFPIPFRVLLAPGSYGVAGASGRTRRIADGEIDKLSEDRNLDFDFASVLSTDPGSVYNFKPRAGYERMPSILSGDGGRARFDVLPFADLVRFVSSVSRWGAASFRGKVFLVDGVPRDGHLAGYPALRALLTGKPWDPSLTVELVEGKGRSGEFWLRVSNPGPTPSELSRFGNVITIRLEGGVFTSLSAGDFDRFEVYATREMKDAAPFGRATACRLYENFFAPEESNEVGPIRIAGPRPRAFVSYQLTLPDGRTINGAEVEVPVTPPAAPSAKSPAKAQPAMPRLRRR